MINLNIDKNNKVRELKDKKHSLIKLNLTFQKMVLDNGFLIKEFENIGSLFVIKLVTAEKKTITIYYIFKNITHSGWKEKPEIKRIQAINLWSKFPVLKNINNINEFFIYFGYYNFDNNPLIVAWDSERYSEHNTNRSCYVNIDSLLWAYEKEYVSTVNSSQKVWIFKEKFFNKFLQEYSLYVRENR